MVPWVVIGFVVSCTVMVWTKFALMLPQPSVKFHVRTSVKLLPQTGVIMSLTKWMAGLAAQLSIAAGANAKAAAMPDTSLHSSAASRLPGTVITTGGMVSTTVTVWLHVAMLPQRSVACHVLVRVCEQLVPPVTVPRSVIVALVPSQAPEAGGTSKS